MSKPHAFKYWAKVQADKALEMIDQETEEVTFATDLSPLPTHVLREQLHRFREDAAANISTSVAIHRELTRRTD